jgi:hypothetical protein
MISPKVQEGQREKVQLTPNVTPTSGLISDEARRVHVNHLRAVRHANLLVLMVEGYKETAQEDSKLAEADAQVSFENLPDY